FHTPRYSVPAVLRRLLCELARRVFDPALRYRARAVVRALDRPADCTRLGWRARTCLAPRIFGAHESGDAYGCPGHRAVVTTGRLVPPPLVQSVQSEHPEIARAARGLSPSRQAAGLCRSAAAA